MLELARQRAAELGHPATLQHGDAHQLRFDDASFDTVVCTFGLCAIPDHTQALAEMTRVLRPGGRLILADHIRSNTTPVRAVQRLLELVTVPLGGEHFLRRPCSTCARRTTSTSIASNGSPSGWSNASLPAKPPPADAHGGGVFEPGHSHERSRT